MLSERNSRFIQKNEPDRSDDGPMASRTKTPREGAGDGDIPSEAVAAASGAEAGSDPEPDDDGPADADIDSDSDTDSADGDESGMPKRSRRGRKKKVLVVGIAASAGGLEALGQFITHLPAVSPMGYVVVQHMAPQHRSMLTQLLGRQTDMKVVEISDGLRVEPNVVYITPPNADLDIRGGVLHLRRPHAAVGPKPSVDYFFTSLAEDQGENAVGIILSGTGSDGAHGIRAVKAAGGITMAQDEESARYNGMPRSAVETGCVDFVLSPDRMGPELTELLVRPRRDALPPADETQDAISRIMKLVKRRHGVDFSNYKQATILRRLKRRMAACRTDKLQDYLAFVENQPGELEQLKNDILISVTSFFRDPDAFEVLGTMLPDVLRSKKPGDPIRIWVAACASGEEAYSLAILLCEQLGDRLAHYQVQIFATDVDGDALARARKGVYPDAALKEMSPETIARYFVARGGFYQVIKSVRDMIVFAKHDVIQDPPFLRIDLITCRNLLIYFNQALQTKVLNIFHYALSPGKYLFLGKSESTGVVSTQFHTVDKKWKIYRRLGESRPVIRDMVGSFQPRPIDSPRAPVRGGGREPSLADVAGAALLRAYVPPTVIVDTEGRILHIQGDVGDLLSLGQGTPDLNIYTMVRRELRGELRSVMVRSQRRLEVVVGGTVFLSRASGGEPGETAPEDHMIRVVVRPLSPNQDQLFLVSFEDAVVPQPGPGTDGANDWSRVQQLEQELAATRENLQTVVEELETSNEELQSLNEELQASNEELQSSNEEFETSNEELQSTNEELTTVNQELQIKSAELTSTNTDLENVLKSLGFPLVVVDRQLRVTRFNNDARRIFDLMPDDVGQTITSVPCAVDLPNLREVLRRVIEGGSPDEQEVKLDGHTLWHRILPFHDERGIPSGAVITVIGSPQKPEHLRRVDWPEHRQAAEDAVAGLDDE